MFMNDELWQREMDSLTAEMIDAGVNISCLSDLNNEQKCDQLSDAVLVRFLPSLKEWRVADAAVSLLRCTGSLPEVIEAILRYFRALMPASYDHSLQFDQRDFLFPGSSSSIERKWQREAKYLIEKGWYLSYEEPPVRGPVLIYQDGFPSPELMDACWQKKICDNVAYFLERNASQSLFDPLVELLLDMSYGAGRAGLVEALVKCDQQRAPQVLMKVLNDPDIGARAMRELARLEYEPARPYFEKFANHPIQSFRQVAKKVLLKLDRKQGRKPPREPVSLPQVLPEEDRIKAAELLAPEGEPPKDIRPKFTQFAIGTVARSEGMDGCEVTVGPKRLKDRMQRLAATFGGDFASSGSALLQEIREAEADAWNAYITKVVLPSGGTEEVWFHYFKEDDSTIQISAWGSADFARQLKPVLRLASKKRR